MFLVTFLIALTFPSQQASDWDPRALEWFHKGEGLIGTSGHYSRQQAEYFEKAVQLVPGFPAARYNLSLIYIEQDQLDKALLHLNVLVELEPLRSRGLRMRAEVRLRQGHLQLAREDLDRALQVDSQDHLAWDSLGIVDMQQGRQQEAVVAFQKALELEPSASEIYFNLARANHQLGQRRKAVSYYKKFLGSHPNNFQGWLLLGVLCREAGQSQQALEALLRAESIVPDNPLLMRELGNLYLELGQLQEAQKRLSRSDQQDVSNLANLGIIARQEGRYREAEVHLRAALEQVSDQALLWAYLGDVLGFQKKEEEAVKAYKKALTYGSGDFSTLYNLAALYRNQGMKERAIEALRKAIQISPTEGRAHYNLAVLLDQQEEHEEAQGHYLEAVRSGFDTAQIRFRMAIFFSLRSEPEKAVLHLAEAFKKAPQIYVPIVRRSLRLVRSDLDSIRYRKDFNDLLQVYESVRDSDSKALVDQSDAP